MELHEIYVLSYSIRLCQKRQTKDAVWEERGLR